MNREAERHLTKAATYVVKGDEFYRKAGEEILAAQEADPTIGYRVIADKVGMSDKWCRDIVRWVTSASDTTHPWAHDTERRKADMTKQVLQEAPMEQVERIIAKLPKDRQKQVAAAAGHEYLKARVTEDAKIRNRTVAEQKEIDAAKEAITLPVRKAVATFSGLGIQGHLEQATEDLRELVEDSSLTKPVVEGVITATNEFLTELKVAIAMVGLEDDLEEVHA